MIVDERKLTPEFRPDNEPSIEFMTLGRDMFPEGSVGHENFPEILEGRVRPTFIFDYELKGEKRPIGALYKQGVRTFADMLRLSEVEVADMPEHMQRAIAGNLWLRFEEKLDDLLLTPHARLIKSVFGQHQGPVEPHEEILVARIVNAALANLKPEDASVLRDRHGLDDWKSKTLKQVGENHGGRSTERMRQIEARASMRLRHPMRGGVLREYSILPLDSPLRDLGLTRHAEIPRGVISHDEFARISGMLKHHLRYITASDDQVRLRELATLLHEDDLPDEVMLEAAHLLHRGVIRNRAKLVFGELLEELAEFDDDPRTFMGFTSIQDLALRPDVKRELGDKGYADLEALVRLAEDNSEQEPLTAESIIDIRKNMGKLGLYLDAIVEQVTAQNYR